MRLDNKRICEHKEGCTNLARIDHVINHVVKRGKLCEKHHRLKHPRKIKSKRKRGWRNSKNFAKCCLCGWEGPCDCHRIEEQGRYIKDNILSVCPNCHRLHHRNIKIIDKNLINGIGDLWEK